MERPGGIGDSTAVIGELDVLAGATMRAELEWPAAESQLERQVGGEQRKAASALTAAWS